MQDIYVQHKSNYQEIRISNYIVYSKVKKKYKEEVQKTDYL